MLASRQSLSSVSEFFGRWIVRIALPAAALFPACLPAQISLTWQQIQDKFNAANPTLQAARLNVDESRAAEVTAYLRPNPNLTAGLDQFSFLPQTGGPDQTVFRPLSNVFPSTSVSYLHEREQKRELRLDVAKKATTITESSYSDQQRALLFTLRNAYVQVLQNKAFLQNAKDNLDYWDRELQIDKSRLDAGDLAQIDYDQLRLQRIPFESDFESAAVNLRTAKIQLLQLLNDRTPIGQFDVTGPYDYAENPMTMEEFRQAALDARPDLRAALQNVELARLNHQLAVANGSADPTFGVDVARNPPISGYIGFSVSIPLRIFDRNQGEKARTEIDIGRNQRLAEAAEAQVLNDVDSAFVTLEGILTLLRPYRTDYLKLAADTRDRVQFAYQNGGASLVEYLNAEKTYRDTRLAYLNLIGSWLTAAAQMNMAVGREVVQ
jgi:cobalt-zinc-cadmium efflux system outer membrane protein